MHMNIIIYMHIFMHMHIITHMHIFMLLYMKLYEKEISFEKLWTHISLYSGGSGDILRNTQH